MRTLRSTFLLLLMAPVLFLPGTTEAALINSVTESLDMSIRPERPKPFDAVTVYIESYAIDLTSSEIAWFIDGKLQKRGLGEKELAFTLGGPGTARTITVVITTLDKAEFRKTLTIRGADVSLLWEAESYTPPFYKGKSRFSYQGTVKVVAMPNIVREDGTRVPARNLVYTWKKDGKVIPDQSGYGKSVLKATGGVPIRPISVSVEVATTDSLYVASSAVTINPEKPAVILYENDPVQGIMFNSALPSGFSLGKQEMVIAALPFHFAVEDKADPDLSYEWNINGQAVRGFGSNLILRREGTDSGRTAISLRVANTARIFQFSSADISVSLPKIDPSASFFDN